MSYVDLATLALHRQQEMDARLHAFLLKCDQAVQDIIKLKQKAQGLKNQLNCDPSQLKERFLSCMKALDEYNYLITDFKLALDNLDVETRVDYSPVHASPILEPVPVIAATLMDALNKPTPSTSKSCHNHCSPEKQIKKRIPKEEQLLIAFSSTSCSSESVLTSKTDKEVQSHITSEVEKLSLKDSQTSTEPVPTEECMLPAQSVLQVDCSYQAFIVHVSGPSFWIIVEESNEVLHFFSEMSDYYRSNIVEMSRRKVTTMSICACYDVETDCYYRGLFYGLTEDESIGEVFLVDIGETRYMPMASLYPLAPKFCTKPPYARCCHLVGIDTENKEQVEKQESLLRECVGMLYSITIDDNSSESLGVFVVLQKEKTVNDICLQYSRNHRKEKLSVEDTTTVRGLPELDEANCDITDCPEYDDPLMAVTGYHNRDEMDICKHYKGGPEKTCFKGTRCTKRHEMKHPDGWTLDRVSVVAKVLPYPTPAPGTWHSVFVSHVQHFDRFFVHFLTENSKKKEELPEFGVVLPPTTLDALVLDMNSPASRMAYKPLKMVPAPGELVTALYPPDEQWYRARVISATRMDQNVEVMFIDYGNAVWVKEDAVRELLPRHCSLRAQAVSCTLAGVAPLDTNSRQWTDSRQALYKLIHEQKFQAHIIARDYNHLTVELYDQQGFRVVDQFAASAHITLVPYSVIDDTDVKEKIVLP